FHEQYQDGYSLYSSQREVEPQAYSDRSAYQGAFRVDAGFGALVNCLAAELEPQRCLTGQAVKSIYDRDSHVEIHGLDQVWQARQIALCLPPRLIAEQLKLVPELDERLLAMMQATPTWMAGHAKVIVEYQQPFWRAQGLSGNALAGYPGAVLAEIFDLCSSSGEYAALGGFSGWPAEYRQQYRDDIPDLVLDQLVHLFGPLAANPLSIQVQDWATETATASALDQALLREHPDYGHAWFQLDHWNDKLYFGGTETAKQSGGYLEGALVAAERIAKALATSQLFAPGSTDILASPSNSY
ncbi:MAG: flavin monoamine oxidase family protein, partial [Oceanobacter sp.]